MKISKFKEKQSAYVLQMPDYPSYGILAMASMKLIEIRVIGIKGTIITGVHTECYGHLMDLYPHIQNRIITKKKKSKGIEIPFNKKDYVQVAREYNENQLLTLEEAKMKMIQYIANDFNDEVCIGCTCHQGPDY